MIPGSVTVIGDGAFLDCDSLKSVEIPNSVTVIGDGAFLDCDSLESVEIPDSVTIIEGRVFRNCGALKNISIPNGVIEIKGGAFDGCASLENIEIPHSVTNIEGSAFYGTKWIENRLEENPLVIVNGILIYARKNEKNFEIPNGVTKIGNGVFDDCDSLESITIPEGVTEIGDCAFCKCDLLKNVNIPKSVTKIMHGAFMNCSSLKNIRILSKETTIGEYAFGYSWDYGDICYQKIENFFIYGYIGSSAEDYARTNGFEFVEIDESTEASTENQTEESTEANTESKTENTVVPSITIGSTGGFSPLLEMTKDKILVALSKLLTEEQFDAIKAGVEALDVKLVVTDIADSVSEAEKELIAKAVESIPDNGKFGYKVMNYLDIRLGALIDGKELNVSETDGEITVSVEIEKPANGIYKIIRIHDGKTDVLDSSLSEDGKRLTFKTDRFSTYAIIFSDVVGGDSTSSLLMVILTIIGFTVLAAGAEVINLLKTNKSVR